MEKRKPFIHIEPHSYYDMGYLVIGRVAAPTYVYLVLYLVPLGLSLFGTIAGVSAYDDGPVPLWTSIFILAFIILLGLGALVGSVIGLYHLVRWLRDSFEIRGPR